MSAFLPSLVAAALIFGLSAPAAAVGVCHGPHRTICVVDGDTIWLDGEKYRMAGYDAPETMTNICGGNAEVQLGHRATARLVQILNAGNISIVDHAARGRYGRGLITIYSGQTDVGDILISEGLARRWPDGREFWCR